MTAAVAESRAGEEDTTNIQVDGEDVCHYCYDGTTKESGAIIKPCNCGGGERTFHEKCLRRAIEASNDRLSRCPVCLYEYNIVWRNSIDWSCLLTREFALIGLLIPFCIAAIIFEIVLVERFRVIFIAYVVVMSFLLVSTWIKSYKQNQQINFTVLPRKQQI